MRFIDLFAGVGGFRLGLEEASEDYECVWSCENDKFCRRVYRYRFGEEPAGDVREVRTEEIPDHELLCAGFPCQSFSIAGERRGFEDTRGTLFHEICRITGAKRPKIMFLENVQGLLSTQDRGAFRVVLESLDELGYDAEWQMLNSKDFGVPQNRPRVYIIGHLGGLTGRQVFPILGGGGRVDEVAGEAEEGRTRMGGEAAALRGGDKWEQVVAPTLKKTYYKGVKSGRAAVIERIGSRYGDKQAGGIYSVDSLSPSLIKKSDIPLISRHGSPLPLHVIDYNWPNHEGDRTIREYEEKVPSLRKKGDLPFVVPQLRELAPTEYERPQEPPNGWIKRGLTEDREGFVEPFPIRYLNRNQRNFNPNLTMTVDGGQTTGIGVRELGKRYRIRRLTPVECERLQGFPDGWTEKGLTADGEEVKISDTQRYKMMGNAVTVNVVRFLGERMMDSHPEYFGGADD